jgi:hypothetical protein
LVKPLQRRISAALPRALAIPPEELQLVGDAVIDTTSPHHGGKRKHRGHHRILQKLPVMKKGLTEYGRNERFDLGLKLPALA